MRRRRYLPSLRDRTVLVHAGERTIEGVIVQDAVDGLVVRAAKLHTDGQVVGMAGDVFVPRDTLVLVQVP